jgi:hypothetical protein
MKHRKLEKVLRINGRGEDTMQELERIGQSHPVPAIHPDPRISPC